MFNKFNVASIWQQVIASKYQVIFCDDGCKTLSQAEKCSIIQLVKKTYFILAFLIRSMDTINGFHLKKRSILLLTYYRLPLITTCGHLMPLEAT